MISLQIPKYKIFKTITMIAETELKVGNWFNHNANWCYRSPSEIKVFKLQWTARDWYAVGECQMSLDDLYAIELTPKILENNLGLKKVDGTSDEYRIGNVVLNLCLYSEGYKVNLYLGGEFLGFHTTVHSLQNLFYSLFGVELKIVW